MAKPAKYFMEPKDKRLQKYLKDNNMSLEEFGRRAGVSNVTVFNALHKMHQMKQETIDKINRVLELEA